MKQPLNRFSCGAIGEEGEQPKSTVVTHQVLPFFFFSISFCKARCISKPGLEVTSSGCWGSWDQPSLKIKAKDCNAAEGWRESGSRARVSGDSLSPWPWRKASQGKKASPWTQQLQLPSCPRLAVKVSFSWEAELGEHLRAGPCVPDGRKHEEGGRLLQVGALTSQNLGVSTLGRQKETS